MSSKPTIAEGITAEVLLFAGSDQSAAGVAGSAPCCAALSLWVKATKVGHFEPSALKCRLSACNCCGVVFWEQSHAAPAPD